MLASIEFSWSEISPSIQKASINIVNVIRPPIDKEVPVIISQSISTNTCEAPLKMVGRHCIALVLVVVHRLEIIAGNFEKANSSDVKSISLHAERQKLVVHLIAV